MLDDQAARKLRQRDCGTARSHLVSGIRKWEARVLGALAILLLSAALAELSDAPRVVLLFGAIAGAFAGGTVWESSRRG